VAAVNDPYELRRLLAQTMGVPELRPPQPPTLIEFLRARIRDDEALALNAFRDYGDGEPKNGPDWFEPWSGTVECGRGGEHIQTFDSGLSRHIVNHSPARALREVGAKRRILDDLTAELHYICDDPWYTCAAATEDREGGTYAETDGGGPCNCGRDERMERRLRFLAAAYSDHPDYREEWGMPETS
jgi:hypothetical protein